MKYIYKPKSEYEKFGLKIYYLLVENFPKSFFVGGMVRDLLLQKKVTDIDIATIAEPNKVVEILKINSIKFNDANKNFGVIFAFNNTRQIEISTFRKDLPSKNRYPKVKFIKSPRLDSSRRDFTINSLYLSAKQNKILNYNNGLSDLKKHLIQFVGDPDKRIAEDPLRIVRALRFALTLNFQLEINSKKAIINNFLLIKHLSNSKILKEITKVKNISQRKLLNAIIIGKKSIQALDSF